MKGIIFDFNGTLYWDSDLHYKAWKEFSALLRDRPFTDEEGLSYMVAYIVPKENGEMRILSADIALMSSKKHDNDATSVFINRMLPTKSGRYSSNIVYADGMEGLHTEDQALEIRRLFDEYQCDYIVLDTNGIGLGVFDALVRGHISIAVWA